MKKLINLFLFAAIAGTSLQSCAKTGCYAVARNGQTSVDNNCNNIADIDENGGNGNGTTNVGLAYFRLAGNILGTANPAYEVDNQGYVMNVPAGEMFAGKPETNKWCYVAAIDQNGNPALIMLTRADWSSMKTIAAWDDISGMFKSVQTNKEFYFLASYSYSTVGSTGLGSAVSFPDGTVHYTSSGASINYKTVASSFH